jgi:endonuclease/exonuclease/phosphatase family metal-dependent hydrolase
MRTQSCFHSWFTPLNNSPRSRPDRYGIRFFALPALIITFGLQILRVFLPSLAWFLRDTVGVEPLPMAVLAFVPILAVPFAAVLTRKLGPRPMLRLTTSAVAIIRLSEQIVREPLLDMLLSLIGTAAFMAFIPVYVEHMRSTSDRGDTQRLALGLLMGSALDTSIRGLSRTLDLSWVPGVFPLVFIALLVLLALWLLWVEPASTNPSDPDVSWPSTQPLLAIGPYLWIQSLIFQNQGWISEISGVSAPGAFLSLTIGNLLSIIGLLWGFNHPALMRPTVSLMVSGFLVFGTATADQPRSSFVIILWLGQFLMGWSWAVLSRVPMRASRSTPGRTTIVISLSMVLFVLMVFLYYGSLGIALPFPRTVLPTFGAGVFALTLFSATLSSKSNQQDVQGYKAAPFAVVLLTLIAFLYWLPSTSSNIEPTEENPTWPIRVMTYNIHSAYAIDGRQDPEAIACIIEQSGADIIALQEISRGWLINGSTDLVSWLSRRLGMPFLFKGTTGPMWGNAIVSRFPVLDYGFAALPKLHTFIGRGYLWATIDLGGQKPLLFIAAHLTHSGADSAVRQEQVPVILEFWDHAPYSIILGDMNAQPDAPEMQLLRDAGLIDAWVETNTAPGLTFSSIHPIERIDWIWHSRDLLAIDAKIIQTTASDHLPIWADLATTQ